MGSASGTMQVEKRRPPGDDGGGDIVVDWCSDGTRVVGRWDEERELAATRR